jgi:hypothetical protein
VYFTSIKMSHSYKTKYEFEENIQNLIIQEWRVIFHELNSKKLYYFNYSKWKKVKHQAHDVVEQFFESEIQKINLFYKRVKKFSVNLFQSLKRNTMNVKVYFSTKLRNYTKISIFSKRIKLSLLTKTTTEL